MLFAASHAARQGVGRNHIRGWPRYDLPAVKLVLWKPPWLTGCDPVMGNDFQAMPGALCSAERALSDAHGLFIIAIRFAHW